MDSRISQLYSYLKYIEESIITLHNIETRFLPVPNPNILLYRLRTTIQLLLALKSTMKRIFHIHERDKMRKIRADWQLRNMHLPLCINLQWCSICHRSSCIFD